MTVGRLCFPSAPLLALQGSSDIHANAAECLSAIARTVPSPLASKLSTPR